MRKRKAPDPAIAADAVKAALAAWLVNNRLVDAGLAPHLAALTVLGSAEAPPVGSKTRAVAEATIVLWMHDAEAKHPLREVVVAAKDAKRSLEALSQALAAHLASPHTPPSKPLRRNRLDSLPVRGALRYQPAFTLRRARDLLVELEKLTKLGSLLESSQLRQEARTKPRNLLFGELAAILRSAGFSHAECAALLPDGSGDPPARRADRVRKAARHAAPPPARSVKKRASAP